MYEDGVNSGRGLFYRITMLFNCLISDDGEWGEGAGTLGYGPTTISPVRYQPNEVWQSIIQRSYL
jgi:hypothetical protein